MCTVSIVYKSFGSWRPRDKKRGPGHQLWHLAHKVIYCFRNLYIDLIQRFNVVRNNLLDDFLQVVRIPLVRFKRFSEDLMEHVTINLRSLGGPSSLYTIL